MLFTRSAATGAPLTNRVTIDNDKLPEDVLEAYRQLYKLQPNYEKLWNSRDGWFKLVHVFDASSTGLVELSLTINTVYGSPPEASLLRNLQSMSCLRRLESYLNYRPDTMYFDIDPPPLYLQALVVGLAAPSLQHLDATLYGSSREFPIPHLCKFICDTECQFTAVRLDFSRKKLKIIILEPVSLEQMGQGLSEPLSTVEELIIEWSVDPWYTEGRVRTDQWRGFCYHVPQVKMVRVQDRVALDVAHSFQQEAGLDLLPTLEQVEPMFTRSAARTLLTNRVTINNHDKLPEDVLLEIFDAYRQLHEHQPDYEKVWNSRDGWFKLAHVHLLFTPRRSWTDPVLRCFPPLLILVDYRTVSWTKKEGLGAIIARHRNRVRGIALQRLSYSEQDAKLLRALNHPFPELESLEILPPYIYSELNLPATFLSGSAPSLRRLTLCGVLPSCLSSLLSSATGLVELALTLMTLAPGAPLFTSLQHMSCLRRLELNLDCGFSCSDPDSPPPPSTGDVISPSELTHLIFEGCRSYFQALVVGLAAPSLQHLNAELCDGQSSSNSHISHLCKFICDTGRQFTVIHLSLSHSELRFYAGTGPQSVDDQPFKIILSEPDSLEQVGRELSGPLSTVEELIIAWDVHRWHTETHIQTDQWRGFCYHVPQVKVVQVPVNVAIDVARSFQKDDGEPVLGLLPSLERIEVHLRGGLEYVSICRAFEPLISARKQAGQTISLSWTYWKTDSERSS
ncbi:hypothetical protein EDB92DRAFT_2040348 [Lactarius akahatsu]|uniref:Uncharacterized protein n=1 Tax=Lactarius akahatsu TaxID=416441 RepID=A0AAD4L716_9AGAM|nr:hypothetical protein EDB92DRAFT_2040348 [Lactarius akahatsu]